MRTTIGIDVAAPADLVFGLTRDVGRWPRLLPHYVRVDVLRREPDGAVVARFVARRPIVAALGLGIPVAWQSRTWNEPDGRRLRFEHRGGATSGMSVTWRIEPAGEGCHVTIEHDFRPRIGVWAGFIDRAFTRPIAGRTLATFKAIAEAIAETALVAGEPAAPSRDAAVEPVAPSPDAPTPGVTK